ncbi:MAG: hypothetical protein RBR15_17930 [Sphaerochaeta sp.]|nr:hypothetical protein [Sphaerochaeta sp.]
MTIVILLTIPPFTILSLRISLFKEWVSLLQRGGDRHIQELTPTKNSQGLPPWKKQPLAYNMKYFKIL